jgi:ankyrin repeat protein
MGAGVAAAQSPLIDAVKQGDPAVVRALLDRGAAVDAAEIDGTTALHWAVHRNDGDIAALLIGAGADVTAANRYGVAPIALASLNGSAPMLARLLAAGADANRAQPEGETALMTAARTGRVEAVRLLLDHDADVNAAEQWRGQTALMWAAAEGHTGAVRELIAHGADVHARSGHREAARGQTAGDDAAAEDGTPPPGFTALLFAVQGGHLDAATVLADAGAEVDDRAPDGSSALVVAIDNRHYELAAWLLDRGADPNADGAGWTALHTAVLAHRPHFRVVPDPSPTGGLSSGALIEALLAAGADPNAPSRERVRLATQTSPLYPTEGVTPFLLAAIAADAPLMRLLLAHGADTSVTTASGSTALMAAAGAATYAGQGAGSEADALEAVTLLLDAGVDVHATDEAGNTALHGAANRGANSVIERLLAHGARLDAANGRGWLPVTIAQGPIDTIEPFPETYALLRERSLAAGVDVPACPTCALGILHDDALIADR